MVVQGSPAAAMSPSDRYRSEPDRRDISLTDLPIVNETLSDAVARIEQFPQHSGPHTLGLGTGRVVREYVPEALGTGYWDFIRPSPHIAVSITEATYHDGYEVRVLGSPIFKLRILLEGTLEDDVGRIMLSAPRAQL